MSSIYKQLVKVFHPDLEQDPIVKAEKEDLTKKLTNAYEKNDLFTLLSLQAEWLNRTDNQFAERTDDQLKIYISILKDQVKALEDSIELLILHPKYMPLQPYQRQLQFAGFGGLILIRNEIQSQLEYFTDLSKQLKSLDKPRVMKELFQVWANLY